MKQSIRTARLSEAQKQMSLSAESIALGLDKGRRIRTGHYTACCPAHDDKSPSLSITQKSDAVLVYCWSGCSQEAVIDALRSLSLWPKKRNTLRPGLTPDQRDYMRLWCLIYRDNVAKGYHPSPEETSKHRRYSCALELCSGR